MMSQRIMSSVQLVSTFVIFLILNGFASALRVDIVPETVDDLSTDTVTITCGATESPDGTRNVVLMELGKRGEHPLVTLGKTKLKYGANKNSNMEAQGSINEANSSQSYLRLTIKNPEMENGGVYVCRLFYVDALGELKDAKEYGNMTVQGSSKTSEQIKEELFKELIQNLTDKVTSLVKTVTDQEKQLQEQAGKVTSLEKTVGDQEKQLQEQTKHSKEQGAKVTSLEKTVGDQEKQLQGNENHSKEHEAKVLSDIAGLVDKEQANSKQINNLNEKGSFVSAFSAGYDSKDAVTNGNTLVFSQSILDVGHHYDTTTGVYTAPRHGLYAFTLAVTTDHKTWKTAVHLQAKGRTVATTYVEDTEHDDQSSVSTVVTLQAGDQVKPVVVYIGGGNYLEPDDHFSLFSGETTVQLQANGHTVASVFAEDEDNDDQSSMSTVVSLQAGDKVKPVVSATEENVLHSDEYHSIFSGYLIHLF